MTLNVLQVRKAVQQGTSPICATCKYFWTAYDLKAPSCGKVCGGPIVGLDFPEYDGPITAFDRFCFACTQESEYAIRGVKAKRLIGVCRVHLALIDRLRPVDSGPAPLDVLSPRGIVIPINGRYTPKTLGEVVYETEKQWAEEAGEVSDG